MKTLFFSLLKKEFLELIQNKKFIVFAFLIVCIFIVFKFLEKSFSDIFYLMIIVFLTTEYIFDSCYNDIKSGATLFYLNMKCSTTYIILAKTVYSVFLGIIIFELDLLLVLKDSSNFDLLWFLPIIIFNTIIVYNVTILTKKSDLLTSPIAMGLVFFIIKSILLLPNFFIRFLILTILSITALVLASKLSKTVKYRVEISTFIK